VQYIVEPLAIFCGIGVVNFFDYIADNKPKKLTHATTITIAIITVCALLIANSATAYPQKTVIGGFQEGIWAYELDGVWWLRVSIHGDKIVATDHRISSMIFGFAKINATWDYAPLTLHAPTCAQAIDEMRKCPTPSGKKRIDYVLIDDEMRTGVALKQWETAKPMSQHAIDKFKYAPYMKVYDNGKLQIYRIDWSLL
jgi:hypothetical protein